MFNNFSLKLNIANRRQCFSSALGLETGEQIKKEKTKVHFDL